ncbi:MAG: hypothetical protein MJE77_21225 [Proteobacteria bacterium]|nr:hypothetical protein [Pseudomonadota bacterium]
MPPLFEPSPILSAFTPLEGGYRQAIAPGDRLVTSASAGATWWAVPGHTRLSWQGGAPVTVALPNIPVVVAKLDTRV